MPNLGSSDTPIEGQSFGLPAGAGLGEDNGELVIKDSSGTIILRRNETASEWQFEGTDLSDINAIDASSATLGSVNTEDANIKTTDVIIDSLASESAVTTAGNWVSPDWDTAKRDNLSEINGNQFTPQEDGVYYMYAETRTAGNANDKDRIRSRLQNVTDSTTVYIVPNDQVSGSSGFSSFPPIAGTYDLTGGKSYEVQFQNRDTDFAVDQLFGRWSIRDVFI